MQDRPTGATRPSSRLFYRYEEGDAYEERLGDPRLVEERDPGPADRGDRRERAAPGRLAARDLLARSAHRRLARDRHPEGAAADRPRRLDGGADSSPGHDRPRAGRAERPRGPRAARLRRRGHPPSRSPPAGHRGADRSAPVRADHAAGLRPDRRPGLRRQRQDDHRPAPDRLLGVRRSAPLPPRQDAGHRLPAGAGGLRVARAAVAGRRGRSGEDVLGLGRGRAPRRLPDAGLRPHRRDPAGGHARQGARRFSTRSSTTGRPPWRPGAASGWSRTWKGSRRPPRPSRSGTAPPGRSTRGSPRSRTGSATRPGWTPPPATRGGELPGARSAVARATSSPSGPRS